VAINAEAKIPPSLLITSFPSKNVENARAADDRVGNNNKRIRPILFPKVDVTRVAIGCPSITSEL